MVSNQKFFKRYGLFGGSFDPVHKGHEALARAAVKELKLDKIFIVPAKNPPHKQKNRISAAFHRINMLRLVFKKEKRYIVSPWEINQGGVSYTEKTIKTFRRRFPKAKWFLIIGGDSFKDFHKWRHWKNILKNCSVVVGKRRGVSLPRKHIQVIVLKTGLPKASSTRVRKCLSAGRSAKGDLPRVVEKYIKKKKLYNE